MEISIHWSSHHFDGGRVHQLAGLFTSWRSHTAVLYHDIINFRFSLHAYINRRSFILQLTAYIVSTKTKQQHNPTLNTTQQYMKKIYLTPQISALPEISTQCSR